MKRKIELLAPGGDIDSIKAAIAAGADAVYCGLDKFNARNSAANISIKDLNGILHLAHKNNCKVFLTLNIIIVESEIPALFSLLNKIVNTSIDGVIIQDLGLLYIVSTFFKSLKIHASTQLTTHNEGQLLFLEKLSVTRVNLSRELNLNEISHLASIAHQNNLSVEVFVHGSYCICFSGVCYMSSVLSGNSGNRGRCSQPCRDYYLTTAAGKNFPFNLKDNSAYSDLNHLYNAGVDAVKIEGRIKKFQYVFTVVDAWRKQLQNFYNNAPVIGIDELFKVFNRDFSNDFLTGNITKKMYIDNPRDNSAVYLSELNGTFTDANVEKAKVDVFNQREEITNKVGEIISQLNISKCPVILRVSGECNAPLKVVVKTPETEFEVLSEINLATCADQPLNYSILISRLKAINETEYYIAQLDLSNLQPDVFLPFMELSSLKRRLLFILNGSRETIEPIAVPVLQKQNSEKHKPMLSVLLSSPNDLEVCNETSAAIYYQIPDCFSNVCDFHIDLFMNNKKLIPWFPSILIGDDYFAAVEFLKKVQPEKIITNNTGIAYQAYKMGIPWIAGPYLNIVNSFGLLCLKENFNCSGAFISNEISKTQIERINKPNDFELYYSICHPTLLMTSRQCLFHQITGCEKDRIDASCMAQCDKTAQITNLKNENFNIHKKCNNFPKVYHEENFLNMDIVRDMPDFFNGFLIDLSCVSARKEIDKSRVIRLFEDILEVNKSENVFDSRAEEIAQLFLHTTKAQYLKGI